MQNNTTTKPLNQNKMEKDFVPYELAVKLKPIGFNEPTSYSWVVNQLYPNGVIGHSAPGLNHNAYDNHLSAPTFSQAFRWFREKYGYWSYVKAATKGTCRFYIEKFDEKFFNSDIIDTYEEAELACLTKLIEIVESKSE